MAKQPMPDQIPMQELRGNRRKKKRRLWIPLIGIGVVTIVAAALYMNRHTIGKAVQKVPVLNQVFKTEEKGPYDHLTKEQLIQMIEEAKGVQTTTEAKLEEEKHTNTLLQEKIVTLKQYENQYASFMKQKTEWDEALAKANPALFMEQFDLMHPEVAERVYKDVVVQEQLTKEQKKHAQALVEMEPEQAAKALEKLVGTDPELVKVLVKSMDTESQGRILSEMQSPFAAQVIKLIAP
ncbi:MAG: hypothetical protein ACRDDX_01070 [Cellulosilyticaceae bacterium]